MTAMGLAPATLDALPELEGTVGHTVPLEVQVPLQAASFEAAHDAVAFLPVPGPRPEIRPETSVETRRPAPRACSGAVTPADRPVLEIPVDLLPAPAETVVEISPEILAGLGAPLPGPLPGPLAAPRRPDSADAPLVEQLVAKAVGGDERARDLLLAEIHPLVLRYCRGRLGRQETVIGSADDVAQEVCLAVVGALPTYKIKGLSFRAFVYGIAAHKVTDAFRAIGRNRSEPMAELPDTAVTHDGPEQRLLAGEQSERLNVLLGRLTPRQREVLILRIAGGLSAEEVAHIVGSTPGAVRVTQHRALNRLRSVMVGHPDAPGDGASDS
jgi:RNA polymerase sigma-70 factor, ECF subfamily